MKIRTCTLP